MEPATQPTPQPAPLWADVAARWGLDPASPPEVAEAALETRWQARLLALLAAEPADTDPPLVRDWRERESRLAHLESALEAERQQHARLHDRTLERELRRTLEALPLQASPDTLLPVLRPLIAARFDLALDERGQLTLTDRHHPDRSLDPAEGLTEVLEPLRLLRRSQAAPQSPASEPDGPRPPALALARAHLEAIRRQ